MDRKEFLSVCGLGACGCAMSLLGPSDLVSAEEPAPADPRLLMARHQVAKMVGFMAAESKAEPYAAILEKAGRECAKQGRLAKFKGDPEGYFAAAKGAWGTEFSWDKQKGTVTVKVREGECGCPLVDSRTMPAFYCNCSVGYQKETFETLFARPVQVTLKESKLSGAKHCVFEVRLG
jgi:hypothetical protein